MLKISPDIFTKLQERIKIIALLNDLTDLFSRRFFVLCAISGISFTAILLLFTHTITKVNEQGAKVKFLILYLLANLIYYIATKTMLYKTSDAIVNTVQKKRKVLVEKLGYCKLEFIEKMEEGNLYNNIILSLNSIANMSINIVGAIPSFIVLFLAMGYLLFLSRTIFLIALVMIAFGLWLSNYQLTALEKQIGETSADESRMNKLIYGLLKGFKELKFCRKKSDDIKQDFDSISETSGELMRKSQYRMSDILYGGDLYSKAMIALFILFLPTFMKGMNFSSDTNTKIITAGFFMLGPIINVIWMANYNSQVNNAISRLLGLERNLDEHITDNSEGMQDDFSKFKKITIRDLGYEYKDKTNDVLFTCGPTTFEVNQGEVFFVVGGNGSGKSTFLKIFTALYDYTGDILVDGKKIDEENIQSYRELYCSVFSDFHIFEKLYGAQSSKKSEVKQLLKRYQIDSKTDFINGRFTNIELSTGQRKRLALIAALLEDKPIIILDEWAADQDPQFRKTFYSEIIPELKIMGKTIFAVSHDETYFQYCDRLIKMHNGQLKELDKNSFSGRDYV